MEKYTHKNIIAPVTIFGGVAELTSEAHLLPRADVQETNAMGQEDEQKVVQQHGKADNPSHLDEAAGAAKRRTFVVHRVLEVVDSQGVAPVGGKKEMRQQV